MKKNKMMRLASALLVLVLLTTCAISGTFAKYTTSVTATDKARVAYWGWAATSIDFDLFDDEYDTTGDTATVDSENGDNVVAPGTSKTEEFTFIYTPKGADVNALTAGAVAAPEVDYTFTIAFVASGDYGALDDNDNFHWTLNGTEYDTVADLTAAVLALSGDDSGTQTYKHGTLPAAFAKAAEGENPANYAITNTIGWEWAYSVDEAGDAADTEMGNAQNLADVTFTITITATQVN